MRLVMFIVIGLIAGSLAGRVMSGHGYGVLGDIILGGIGAWLGGWMFARCSALAEAGFRQPRHGVRRGERPALADPADRAASRLIAHGRQREQR